MTYLILALATWRISALLTKEAGPFHVFEKLRELAGITHDSDGGVQMIPSKFFAELLSCVWCASIWVASGWVILYVLVPDIAFMLAFPLALSTIAIFVDRFS
jgi:hypothetical protein